MERAKVGRIVQGVRVAQHVEQLIRVAEEVVVLPVRDRSILLAAGSRALGKQLEPVQVVGHHDLGEADD